METSSPKSAALSWSLALLAGWALLFHFWGNTAAGYGHSSSLWAWWGSPWWDPAADLQHGPLVVLGALWLGVRAWREAPAAAARVGAATFWCLAATLLHGVALRAQVPRLSVGAVVLVGHAWALLLGGQARARALGPAWVFLGFSLYWGFLDSFGLGVSLRKVLAEGASHLLGWLGTDVVRQGSQLLPVGGGQAFEVAAACAGVRTLTALVALTFFVSSYIPTLRRWRVLLVVLAVGLVWLGNLVRICLAVLAQSGRTPDWLHTALGLAVFVAEFGLLALVAQKLERRPTTGPAVAATPPLGVSGVLAPAVWVRFFLLTGVAGALSFWASGRVHGPAAPSPVVAEWLGAQWLSRSAPLAPIEAASFPAETRWDRRIFTPLGDPTAAVLVTVVQAGADRTSIHRPELCLSGLGWAITDRRVEGLAGADGLPVTSLVLARDDGKRALMLYWFARGSETRATYREMLLAWVGGLLRPRGQEPWTYWSVQTLVGPGGEAEARGSLQSVAVALRVTQLSSSTDVPSAGVMKKD